MSYKLPTSISTSFISKFSYFTTFVEIPYFNKCLLNVSENSTLPDEGPPQILKYIINATPIIIGFYSSIFCEVSVYSNY